MKTVTTVTSNMNKSQNMEKMHVYITRIKTYIRIRLYKTVLTLLRIRLVLKTSIDRLKNNTLKTVLYRLKHVHGRTEAHKPRGFIR